MIVQNIKVITSVGRAQEFLDMYRSRVDASKQFLYSKVTALAITSFAAQFCIYGYIAFGLWWAMWLVIEGFCDQEEFLCSFIPLMFSVMFAGMQAQFVPDQQKAISHVTHSHTLVQEEDT